MTSLIVLPKLQNLSLIRMSGKLKRKDGTFNQIANLHFPTRRVP